MENEKGLAIQQLTREVAAALGNGWQYVAQSSLPLARRDGRDGWLQNGDMRIVIAADGRFNAKPGNGRFLGCVALEMQDFANGRHHESAPEINVNIFRPAATIANEIKRRLLPELTPYAAKIREAFDKQAAHDAKTVAASKLLIASAGKDKRGNDALQPNSRTGHEPCEVFRYYPDSELYGDVQVTGESIKLEIRSLRPDEAAYILAYLATARKAVTE